MSDLVNTEDNEGIGDLEDMNGESKTENLKSHMETLDRKMNSRDAVSRSSQSRRQPQGLVESMMACVITDSTLEHAARNHQIQALTPRTERRYKSPLLSGRRVASQIPIASVSNSPLHSPKMKRRGHERVRVYESPAR